MNTATIRNEIKNELTNAVKNGLTSGNIVTSDGKVIKFTVKYYTWHLTTGTQSGYRITIVKGDHTVSSVEYAASAALYEYGYTKYYRAR